MAYSGNYRALSAEDVWLVVATEFIANPMQLKEKKPKRNPHALRLSMIYAPVNARTTFINYIESVIVFETSRLQSHAILAPVSGKLCKIEHQNGSMYNSVFVADSNKEGFLSLYFYCPVPKKTVHLMIVTKPHGVTSRVRIQLKRDACVGAGDTIGYAGGSFETRLTVPRSAQLRIKPNDTVHGRKSLVGSLDGS
jgi:hypothetical protein